MSDAAFALDAIDQTGGFAPISWAQVTDAFVEGEWLTLSIAGQPLKLRRSSAA